MEKKKLNELFINKPVHSIRELKECPMLIEKLIRELGKTTSLSENELYELQVAVTEICYNGIEHGNRFSPDKEVRVSYLILDDRVIFKIEDEGEGFDPQNIPDPTKKENILKPRGRGIFLARRFSDELIFDDRGRRVFIIKKIKKK